MSYALVYFDDKTDLSPSNVKN